LLFGVIRLFCFYRFRSFPSFSGNAAALLLPFSLLSLLFGQCNGSAFTVFTPFTSFRSMQRLCFYRFSSFVSLLGKAAHKDSFCVTFCRWFTSFGLIKNFLHTLPPIHQKTPPSYQMIAVPVRGPYNMSLNVFAC
jgi:hypothetical protein